MGATTLSEIVAQEPEGVKVDTLHGVSQSLHIIVVADTNQAAMPTWLPSDVRKKVRSQHGRSFWDPWKNGAQGFPHCLSPAGTCRERPPVSNCAIMLEFLILSDCGRRLGGDDWSSLLQWAKGKFVPDVQCPRW